MKFPVIGQEYEREVRVKIKSPLAGDLETVLKLDEPENCWNCPIIQAFLAEDHYQEITLISTNELSVRTMTKIRRTP